ncbi:MAG: N-acetyltransferase [Clostridiales bacterium]|nr:N-acetyltransferase [Clostridiales bacterium]
MSFKHETDRIYLENENGDVVAEVTFPVLNDEVVNINHTFVDPSLRGQGVASKLMLEVAKKLRQENKKAMISCSYAVQWFDKNKEYKDVVYMP